MYRDGGAADKPSFRHTQGGRILAGSNGNKPNKRKSKIRLFPIGETGEPYHDEIERKVEGNINTMRAATATTGAAAFGNKHFEMNGKISISVTE